MAILAIALLYGLFRLVLHRTVSQQLQTAAKTIPGCIGIRYQEIILPHLSLQCRIMKARLLVDNGRIELPIQEIHIRRLRPGGRLPRALHVALHGIRLDTRMAAMRKLREPLMRLGYPEPRMDLSLNWERRGEPLESWDLEGTMHVADAGNATVRLRMDKVNGDGVALALTNPINWLMVIPSVELLEGRFAYDDEGLARRALDDWARSNGQAPETARAALMSNFHQRGLAAHDPRVRSFWQTMAAFTRTPGQIVLHTELQEPFPLGRLLWMRQPEAVIRGLSIASRATPRRAAAASRRKE
jgi:hypothetical protein